MKLREKIPVGEVAYYINKEHDFKWHPWFGIVVDNYPDTILLQLYDIKRIILIDGKPGKNIFTPTRWKKLPKKWSCDTQLFRFEVTSPDPPKSLEINRSENIKEGIKSGFLVKVIDNDYARYESEIDAHKGWRMVKRYDNDYHRNIISVPYQEAFLTYEEANNVCEKYKTELERQANLSDYDWSVEQIDRVLDRWNKMYGDDGETKKNQMRDFLLKQKNVEDIETRLVYGRVQWKYWKNKRWIDLQPK